MRTRSSSNLIVESSTIPKRRNHRRSKQIVEPELRTIVETPVVSMADTHTMSELLQAPTEGYGDAIVIPAILAEKFELKVGLLQLVTSSEFHGFERNDPHAHILSITTSSSSPSSDITALIDIVKELVLMNKANQQDSVKAVDEICVTCGGPHPYYECLATDSNTFNAYAATRTYNQGVGPSNELTNYMKSNEATLRTMQTQMTNMKTELWNEFKSSLDTRTNKIEYQNNQIMNMLTNLTMQKKNPSGSRSLPSNTVANPRGDVKAMTTRSGVAYDGPTIPPTSSPLPKEVERETEATKDKVQTTSSESTAHVQPPVVQIPIPEPEIAPKSKPKPSIPYPSRLNDQKLREKANNQMYGYIKNHKKTVKNGQARTRESEEYKKKPKNQSRSQKSQASVKSSQRKVKSCSTELLTNLSSMDHTSAMVKAQRGVGFALDPLTELAQHVTSKNVIGTDN
ncbi:hypothetical protein Tco_0665144 [Tanacetum coccineum]